MVIVLEYSIISIMRETYLGPVYVCRMKMNAKGKHQSHLRFGWNLYNLNKNQKFENTHIELVFFFTINILSKYINRLFIFCYIISPGYRRAIRMHFDTWYSWKMLFESLKLLNSQNQLKQNLWKHLTKYFSIWVRHFDC